MRRFHTVGVVVAVALLGVSVGAATAAENLQSLIQKVDAKLYYPQQVGLRSLQADVESSRLGEMLKDSPEAKNVKLMFHWSAPYKQRFILSGVPEGRSEDARRFEGQLAIWGERLVPKPLALTLAGYKCTVGEDEKSFSIDAQSTAPSARIEAMKYTIDKKTLLPMRWHIATSNFSADVAIKYEPLAEDKSLPVEMKAKADQNDITLKMTWKKIEKLTLAESLTIAFVGDDGATRTSSLRLSNHKINQPLPADVFPASEK
jgi:hypothetical protein